jgi:D-alanyl-D-alanine-carboxypeptidase/D-alanyl-D-alanine-endopeptidase
MKRYFVIALMFACISSVFAQLPADSIKAILKDAVKQKRAKGIIVGIIDANGRKFFSEGIANDNNSAAPDQNTIFEIGSITKIFTSLVLADMSLKHELNLTDPISKFLPKAVKTPVTNGHEISLLSLSTHRSTFPRFPYNVDPKDLDKPYVDYTVKQLYQYISDYKPDMDIDSRWRYSNTAYGLLGSILTQVAKEKNYEALIINEICKPLSMSNTVIMLTPQLKLKAASGHSEYGAPVNFIDLGAIEAGGALRSDANDLLTFAAANLDFIQSDLSPAMELTHAKQAKKDGNNGYVTLCWTLWDDYGKYILFKDGGTPGFRTFIGIDKKNKFGVVVLSNTDNGVTDIGTHIIDPVSSKLEPYKYNWKLLDTLRTTVKTQNVEAAIALYNRLKGSKNSSFVFEEKQLNYLGNELRREKKISDAIKIFELNLEAYPKSPMMYESLGEIYRRNGNKKKAITYFEKARELEPQNLHWDFILNKLKE